VSGTAAGPVSRWKAALIALFLTGALQLSARDKNGVQYGAGLIVNVPFTPSQVELVLQDVVQNGIIRGTKEYNKDPYVDGAVAAATTKAFPAWTEGGKVFYKVRLKALDPRNFKDSGDVGTLAVRYVVQPQGEKNSVLRIDAVFVEDFRKVSHPSDGSVEGAEYKDIHDRLDAIESMREQTVEAQKEKQQYLTQRQQPALTTVPDAGDSASTAQRARDTESVPNFSSSSASNVPSNSASISASSSNTGNGAPQPPQAPEEQLKDLRRQVQRLVKEPGAPLKSAPFHTATTLQTLTAGTEVLIVVSTTYWLGVETHEGQHGWVLRDELEQVP
jgi:hypothetical protein